MTEATTPKPRRPLDGGGSMYEAADGRWHAAIIWKDPDTGHRTRRTVSGKTQAIVKGRLADLRKDLATTGRPTSKTTLAEFLTTWLEAEKGRIRASSWRGRELHVRGYIIPALGGMALADLRPSDVDRMTAGLLATGRSGVTARHARGTLRRALSEAERDGLVARNVAALSRPPKIERHEIQVLTVDETRRLLEATEDDEHGPLYALAATTGLRQGELLGLAWTDIDGLDSPTPTLTVRHSMARVGSGWDLAEPKTRRSRRTLELGATAARALRRQRTRQKEARLAAGDLWQGDKRGLVFTDPLGRPETGYAVGKAFRADLERLGLPHVRFHDLRHGVASLMLAQGVPLKLVSDALGHSTIGITADTYAHLDREQRREAVNAIERAIGGEL